MRTLSLFLVDKRKAAGLILITVIRRNDTLADADQCADRFAVGSGVDVPADP